MPIFGITLDTVPVQVHIKWRSKRGGGQRKAIPCNWIATNPADHMSKINS